MSEKKQRKYKDTVYRMLFKEPDKALSLYNSLNGTSYTDESMLEFNTLENAIYMGMKNDLSFLILDQMHLYEQQATYTPNMPLRDLFYVADLLQEFVKDKSLYSSKRIKLPTPHFVVFYNGTAEKPEKVELKLSDAFEVPSGHPELELKVQIFNINPGMNEELKARCPALKEYVIYVEKVRKYAKSMAFEEAVEQAIEECIRDDVLREFLQKQRAEVFKMSIYEYDEEREMRLIRADEREIGKEIGIELGREEERINTEKERLEKEKALEKAEEERINTEKERLEKEQALKKAEENIKGMVLLCREVGKTREETIEKLIEKCKLDKKTAAEKVKIYWE